jgi:class 3 adenylate cyclase
MIERHGATVEKFIGDAVMAVFGVPVVHEDDAGPGPLRPRGRRAARGCGREAVEIAARTDCVILHGDALLALADVREAVGDAAGAEAPLHEALALFEARRTSSRRRRRAGGSRCFARTGPGESRGRERHQPTIASEAPVGP